MRYSHTDPKVHQEFTAVYTMLDALKPKIGDIKIHRFNVTVINARATDVPDGWLLCNGQSVNIQQYPALFDALGYAFNLAVSGTGGFFNVPSLTALDNYTSFIIRAK